MGWNLISSTQATSVSEQETGDIETSTTTTTTRTTTRATTRAATTASNTGKGGEEKPPSRDVQEDLEVCSLSSVTTSTTSTTSVVEEEEEVVEELKEILKSLLAKHDGSTKHPDVLQAVTDLATHYNSGSGGASGGGVSPPLSASVAQSPDFCGNFATLTCPNFPGRLRKTNTTKDMDKEKEKDASSSSSLAQYTLGHLSFNIFQPSKLVCTLRSVRNPVSRPIFNKKKVVKDGRTTDTWNYPLVLDITIHTGHTGEADKDDNDNDDLPAILINEAYCYEHPTLPHRFQVCFTGGTLLPAPQVLSDPTRLALWSRTFEGAYQQADQERSYVGWMMQWVLRWVLGLTLPSSSNQTQAQAQQHSFHFDIKRSPIGYLDVLYLDQDLRITKGNRGTIVVVELERQSPSNQHQHHNKTLSQ